MNIFQCFCKKFAFPWETLFAHKTFADGNNKRWEKKKLYFNPFVSELKFSWANTKLIGSSIAEFCILFLKTFEFSHQTIDREKAKVLQANAKILGGKQLFCEWMHKHWNIMLHLITVFFHHHVPLRAVHVWIF